MNYELHKCNASDTEIDAINKIESLCTETIGKNCESEHKFYLHGLDTVENVKIWFEYDNGEGEITLNYNNKWEFGEIDGFEEPLNEDLTLAVKDALDDLYLDEGENERVIDEP